MGVNFRFTGLGRSKFLPKPLPAEINMLLSECDVVNCHHDGAQLDVADDPTQPYLRKCAVATAGANLEFVNDDDDDDDNSRVR